MEFYHFTPVSALIGGLMIGLASTLLMWTNGRIAGISGILGGLLPPASDASWRLAFVIGLICGGLAFTIGGGDPSSFVVEANTPVLIAAGLLVGYGTRLGSGCTSGHGVCGIGRMSRRSITSTVIFIVLAAITVYITHHVIGG